MESVAPIAFTVPPEPPAALEIRVNFGVVAGRSATPAELDDLGATLLEQVRQVSIVAEERHEMSPESEAAVYQVRVDLPDDASAGLESRLVGLAEQWALTCATERHTEPFDAS